MSRGFQGGLMGCEWGEEGKGEVIGGVTGPYVRPCWR
jgi:hypothetical protein